MFTGLVRTPPTPVSVLEEEPREAAEIAGAEILQLRVSPQGDFLAALAVAGESRETRIFLYGLKDEGLIPFKEISAKGYRLDWREEGGRSLLVYEDAGDILQLDPGGEGPVGLAGGSDAFDSDPVPSPDGAVLLFKRITLEGPARPQLWALSPLTGEARFIAPWNGEPRWAPDSSRIAVLYPLSGTAASEISGYQVELFDASGGGKQLITFRRREVFCLDWIDHENLLVVSPYRPEESSETKGVAYKRRADVGGGEEAVGTLRSIGDERGGLSFFLDRQRRRLAYAGSFGLEFFDLEERRVYRWKDVHGFDALDWLPDGKGVAFARGGIIYLLKSGR